MRLVLFDIDGTLLVTKGAGRQSLKRALTEVYGTAGPCDTWNFGGKTDPLLVRELMREAGLASDRIEAGLDDALGRYLAYLDESVQSGATCHLMPGVVPLLERLASDERVVLGLLTGNMAEGARLKLTPPDLCRYFRMGAYGCDHGDRTELPAVAVRRAEELTGRTFSGKEIVIIGDTPADIKCGRGVGARSIAVATGSYTPEALAEHAPDFLFPTLESEADVLEAIFSDLVA